LEEYVRWSQARQAEALGYAQSHEIAFSALGGRDFWMGKKT
jgi:hypothetical protein